jgi:hypothetical protein
LLPSLWNFWTIEYHHAIYWKYGTLAGLGSRPLAQVTMDSELITILSLRPFKWALICSIWTTGTRFILVKVFFLVRVLVKARFLDILRPRTSNPRPFSCFFTIKIKAKLIIYVCVFRFHRPWPLQWFNNNIGKTVSYFPQISVNSIIIKIIIKSKAVITLTLF